MLIGYPSEWEEYLTWDMIIKKGAPQEIIDGAKKCNKSFYEETGKTFFRFEEDKEDE